MPIEFNHPQNFLGLHRHGSYKRHGQMFWFTQSGMFYTQHFLLKTAGLLVSFQVRKVDLSVPNQIVWLSFLVRFDQADGRLVLGRCHGITFSHKFWVISPTLLWLHEINKDWTVFSSAGFALYCGCTSHCQPSAHWNTDLVYLSLLSFQSCGFTCRPLLVIFPGVYVLYVE